MKVYGFFIADAINQMGTSVAFSEDGRMLVQCRSTGQEWSKRDLGMHFTSTNKHDVYREFCGEDFEVEFVEQHEVGGHEGLQAALVAAGFVRG